VQVVKTPPSSHLILAAAGIKDGSAKPSDPPVGAVSLKHIYEIAKVYRPCLSCLATLLQDFE
jgi:ribosomal protein L11